MKKLLLLLTLSACVAPSWGVTLTPAEALSRLYASPDNAARHVAPSANTQLKFTVMTPQANPAIYVFSQPDNSLMFVGADDLALPLLGYTDTSVNGDIPPQLQGWLDNYALEIGQASKAAAHGATSPEAKSAPGEATPARSQTSRPPVFCLLPSNWNQSTPYNNLCPTVNGNKCYTGCTATAAAQIMNYHKYPSQGTGSITYTPNEGRSGNGLYTSPLSLDFSTVTFDWDNMVANYETTSTTSAQQTAVATLMKAVGYAAQMDYGTNASGAAASVCLQGMKDYFGYNTAGINLSRQNFSLEAWENLLYENLGKVGPVLYSGFNLTSAGHAFVCDGYYGGYYHFNWGWGGSYNGFFTLTALTPAGEGIGGNGSGDYSFDQNVCLNITKPDGATIEIDIAPFYTRGNLTASIDGSFLVISSDQNWAALNQSSQTHKETFAARIVGEDGEEYLLPWYYSYSELPPNYGMRTLNFPLNVTLPDGSYKVYLMCKAYGAPDSEFTPTSTTVGSVDFARLIVNDGNFSVEAVEPPSLEITDFEVETALYLFTDFRISYTVANTSEVEILDGVQPYIYTKTTASASNAALRAASTPGTSMAAVGDGVLYDLLPGDGKSYTQTSGMTCYTASVPSGQVYIGLRSSNTGQILAEKAVTLGNKPASPSLSLNRFNFEGNANSADANDLRFNVGVSCASGYMAAPVRVVIFPKQTGTVYSITDLKSNSLFLSAGQSEDVTVAGAFPQGETGKSYFAIPYNGSNQLGSNRVYFTVGTQVSSTDEVNDGLSDAPVAITLDRATSAILVSAPQDILSLEVYSIDGRLMTAEGVINGDCGAIPVTGLPAGILIVRVTLSDGTLATAKLAN